MSSGRKQDGKQFERNIDDVNHKSTLKPVDRRTFLAGATVTAASFVSTAAAAKLSWPHASASGAGAAKSLGLSASLADDADLAAIRAEVAKRHDQALQRLQTWIKQPSIAAENRGVNE